MQNFIIVSLLRQNLSKRKSPQLAAVGFDEMTLRSVTHRDRSCARTSVVKTVERLVIDEACDQEQLP